MTLNDIAKKMCAKGKGILAADESTGTIDMVPLRKFLFSKYPAGPFHNTVLDSLIIFLIFFTVLVPISKIISFFSIFFKSLFLPSPFKLVPTTQSSGITILQLFSFALS